MSGGTSRAQVRGGAIIKSLPPLLRSSLSAFLSTRRPRSFRCRWP
uniref:Uncharacterized protein n=1 Tax=Anguilla anguilla TaxID=7936 RepID=A0A0E9W295_ANGAN